MSPLLGSVRGMRFALSIPPFTDPATVVRIGVAAEASGWDAVMLWDHVQWRASVEPEVHDPWVLLGALATRTERVLLGTLVTPLSRRRPTNLAKQLTTLDHLSMGRAVLGVGLGEPPDRDFSDLGDEADPRVRAAMLDEALTVLDGLLRGDRVDHDGEHFTVHAQFTPGPRSRPRPRIWVAGVVPNKRPLARARRWDAVVPIGTNLTPDGLRDYLRSDGTDQDRAGWDVVAPADGVHPPAAWAEAGATWLVYSALPVEDGWVEELQERARQGPPR